MRKEELKVGDVVKLRLYDTFDRVELFGVDEVVFRVSFIKGYVFGKILNGKKANSEFDFAFHITDESKFEVLDKNEAMIQYGL